MGNPHGPSVPLNRRPSTSYPHADLRLGLVGAAVIALCERLGQTRVATLDHRHFTVVRTHHCPHLTLLPD